MSWKHAPFFVPVLWAILPFAIAAAADRLPIETAPQDPDIHPIAPQDGADAVTNPPSIVFWYSPSAYTYTVEMSRRSDFHDAVIVRRIQLPFYNHTAALTGGKWHWRYYFETKDGKRSEHSRVRTFRITDRSIPFPVPPVSEILKRMRGHPRIYTTEAELPAFRARKDREARGAFQYLLRAVEWPLTHDAQEPQLGPKMPENPNARAIAFWLKDGEAYQALGPKISASRLDGYWSVYARNLAMADLLAGTACIHCIFDEADGPNQVLLVDDIEFGRVAE